MSRIGLSTVYSDYSILSFLSKLKAPVNINNDTTPPAPTLKPITCPSVVTKNSSTSCDHGIAVHFFSDVQTDIHIRRQVRDLPRTCSCLCPCPRAYQLPNIGFASFTLALEDRLVDIGSHGLPQLDVQQLLKLRRHLLKWVDHERHGALKSDLVNLISRHARSELPGSELNGGAKRRSLDITTCRSGGKDGAGDLDELELEKVEVEKVVRVEDLERACQQGSQDIMIAR
jgi:hypothetical protein